MQGTHPFHRECISGAGEAAAKAKSGGVGSEPELHRLSGEIEEQDEDGEPGDVIFGLTDQDEYVPIVAVHGETGARGKS